MSESSENIDEGDHEKVKDLRTPFQLYLNYKMKGCDLNESDRVALQTKYTKRYERMDKRRKYQWIKQAYQSELKAICRYQRRNEVEMKVACKYLKTFKCALCN